MKKKIKNSFIILALAVMLTLALVPAVTVGASTITDSRWDSQNNRWTDDYLENGAAQEYLDIVNRARAAEGISPLTMTDEMELWAKIRADEQALSLAVQGPHTRPDGTDWYTVGTGLMAEIGGWAHSGAKHYRSASVRIGNTTEQGYGLGYIAVAWFQSSAPHDAYQMNSTFTEAGIAFGRDRNGDIYPMVIFRSVRTPAAPTITVQPADQSATAGQSVTFSANASSSSSFTDRRRKAPAFTRGDISRQTFPLN